MITQMTCKICGKSALVLKTQIGRGALYTFFCEYEHMGVAWVMGSVFEYRIWAQSDRDLEILNAHLAEIQGWFKSAFQIDEDLNRYVQVRDLPLPTPPDGLSVERAR